MILSIINIFIFLKREFQNKANFESFDLFCYVFLFYHLICSILVINKYQINLFLLLIGSVIAFTNKSENVNSA